ncbi:MAG: carboxypeptidase regulatory-like domain-containing protein, partial [Methanobacteriales archaeon]
MKIIRKLAITISLLLIFLAIGTVNATNNQTGSNTFISGTVTYCNSTEPFQGATIDVKTPQGSTITSNITDPNGKYNISFYSTENTLIVSAIAPGHIIPTQTINLDETRSAEVNFQLGTLTLTKGSWDTIGLDHNNVNQGPNQYLVQIRVTNNALTTATNVTANFTWTTTNPYINLAPNENATKNLGDIPAGATVDALYLIEITRTSTAYDTSRNYTVTVAGTNTGTSDTITGSLYVQKLVSQNRNDVLSITANNTTPLVGDTITVTVVSQTASATYNIVNLPLINYNPTILQPLNVTISYGTSTSNNVRLDNPGATNFNSVWYFKVIGTGTTQLFGLITDQSGTSYHYNGDYGENITINVPPEADLGITKAVNNTAPRFGETVKFTLNVTNIGPDTAA